MTMNELQASLWSSTVKKWSSTVFSAISQAPTLAEQERGVFCPQLLQCGECPGAASLLPLSPAAMEVCLACCPYQHHPSFLSQVKAQNTDEQAPVVWLNNVFYFVWAATHSEESKFEPSTRSLVQMLPANMKLAQEEPVSETLRAFFYSRLPSPYPLQELDSTKRVFCPKHRCGECVRGTHCEFSHHPHTLLCNVMAQSCSDADKRVWLFDTRTPQLDDSEQDRPVPAPRRSIWFREDVQLWVISTHGMMNGVSRNALKIREDVAYFAVMDNPLYRSFLNALKNFVVKNPATEFIDSLLRDTSSFLLDLVKCYSEWETPQQPTAIQTSIDIFTPFLKAIHAEDAPQMHLKMNSLREKACRILGVDESPSHSTQEVKELFLSPYAGSDGEAALSVDLLAQIMAFLRFGDFNDAVNRAFKTARSERALIEKTKNDDEQTLASKLKIAHAPLSSLGAFFNILHCICNIAEFARGKMKEENKTKFQSFLRRLTKLVESPIQMIALKKLSISPTTTTSFDDYALSVVAMFLQSNAFETNDVSIKLVVPVLQQDVPPTLKVSSKEDALAAQKVEQKTFVTMTELQAYFWSSTVKKWSSTVFNAISETPTLVEQRNGVFCPRVLQGCDCPGTASLLPLSPAAMEVCLACCPYQHHPHFLSKVKISSPEKPLLAWFSNIFYFVWAVMQSEMSNLDPSLSIPALVTLLSESSQLVGKKNKTNEELWNFYDFMFSAIDARIPSPYPLQETDSTKTVFCPKHRCGECVRGTHCEFSHHPHTLLCNVVAQSCSDADKRVWLFDVRTPQSDDSEQDRPVPTPRRSIWSREDVQIWVIYMTGMYGSNSIAKLETRDDIVDITELNNPLNSSLMDALYHFVHKYPATEFIAGLFRDAQPFLFDVLACFNELKTPREPSAMQPSIDIFLPFMEAVPEEIIRMKSTMNWLRDKACRILGVNDESPSRNASEVRELFLTPIAGSNGEPALSVSLLAKIMAFLRFGDFNDVMDRFASMMQSFENAAFQKPHNKNQIDFPLKAEHAFASCSSLRAFFDTLHCICYIYEFQTKEETKIKFQTHLEKQGVILENQKQLETLGKYLCVQKHSARFDDFVSAATEALQQSNAVSEPKKRKPRNKKAKKTTTSFEQTQIIEENEDSASVLDKEVTSKDDAIPQSPSMVLVASAEHQCDASHMQHLHATVDPPIVQDLKDVPAKQNVPVTQYDLALKDLSTVVDVSAKMDVLALRDVSAVQDVVATPDVPIVSNVSIVSDVLASLDEDTNEFILVKRCQTKTTKQVLQKKWSTLLSNPDITPCEPRDTLCSSGDDSRRHKDVSKQRHCNSHGRNAMDEYDAVMQRVRGFMLDTRRQEMQQWGFCVECDTNVTLSQVGSHTARAHNVLLLCPCCCERYDTLWRCSGCACVEDACGVPQSHIGCEECLTAVHEYRGHTMSLSTLKL